MNVFDTTKSDELAEIRQIFSEDGLFGQFGSLFQINLILDANAVLADIRWLVCKATNPNARTSLIEAIDAKTVVAHAPTFLHNEIEKNIPIIAKEEGIDASLFFLRWEQLKHKIDFIECGGPVEGAIDPKDAPYANAHEITGYPVLTEDPHITRMGAESISITVSTFARDYSREAVIEYRIKAGALGVFVITESMIQAASNLVRSLAPHVRRIPTWVWLLVIAGFVVALSFEAFRVFLLDKLKDFSDKTMALAKQLFLVLEPVVVEHQSRHKQANLAKEAILREISNA